MKICVAGGATPDENKSDLAVNTHASRPHPRPPEKDGGMKVAYTVRRRGWRAIFRR